MGRSPLTWSRASFRLPLHEKGCFALDRGKFRGLKLTEQAVKVTERIAKSLNRQVVTNDESQFGFVTGRGTTDAIFVICRRNISR